MKMFNYKTNCTLALAEDIESMVDGSREITYETFMRHVSDYDLEALFPFYNWRGRGGLTLRNDYAVSFFKGNYVGKPVYYVQHSCIEYIFGRW